MQALPIDGLATSGTAAPSADTVQRSPTLGAPPGRNRPAVVALWGALVSLATALIALAAVDILVHRIVLRDLRNTLTRTALATAALIDGDEFRRFTRPEQDTTEEYRKASRPLRVLLETNPDIRFAYSGVTHGDRMHFVLDGSPLDAKDNLGATEHAAPMHEDRASPGEIEITRTHQVTVEAVATATAWGMGIRAQAPIVASDGAMVGYVGLTMRADQYAHLIHRTDFATALGAAIAGCLALVTGLGILRTERARELAERARAAFEERLKSDRDQLFSYAQALDRADEDSRRATAVQLHEGVGQVLTGLKMMLGSARAQIKEESLKNVIDNAESAAQAAQSGIRTIVQDLWPPELEHASLAQMMTWIASLFDARYGFKILWKIEGEALLSRDHLMLIYRMVREIVDDLQQQSKCRETDVKIHLTLSRIGFQVMDKGVGFEASQWIERSNDAFSLTRVRERVQAAGGKFEMVGLPGGGCWVAVEIPL